MSNVSSELIDIKGLGLTGVFKNSFNQELTQDDELYCFDGKEVELVGYHFDYRQHNMNVDPDIEVFPMTKIRLMVDGEWRETCAWCDEINPVPPLIEIYLSALQLGSKHNFETLEEYEAQSALENPYHEGTQERDIFQLGFSVYYYKK